MAKDAIYRDIDFKLRVNPVTKDIVTVDNEAAIKQSIGLLFKTRYYNRVFQPWIGSWIHTLLFNLNDSFAQINAKEELLNLIKNHEPRVEVTTLEFITTPEGIDRGELKIRLGYYIKNLNKVDYTDLLVQRTR